MYKVKPCTFVLTLHNIYLDQAVIRQPRTLLLTPVSFAEPSIISLHLHMQALEAHQGTPDSRPICMRINTVVCIEP